MPQTGHDTNGKIVAIGDTDSDGYPVGYISDAGLAYVDREERDRCETAGRYQDAVHAWKKHGSVGPAPSPLVFALAIAAPENVEAAVCECVEQDDFMALLKEMIGPKRLGEMRLGPAPRR